MNIMESLIGVVAPHECINCSVEGKLLCETCLLLLPKSQPCCYRCRKPSISGLTCQECINETNIEQVQVTTVYQAIPKQLVWKLKMSGAKSAASVIAKRMSDTSSIKTEVIIVPVPTATSRARLRGYDQAKLIAMQLSKQVGLTYRDSLARSGQMHQHGLAKHDRLNQLKDAYRVKRSKFVKGAQIILVDDVITTGATLEAAALALHEAGAKRIEAIVFARPDINKHNVD